MCSLRTHTCGTCSPRYVFAAPFSGGRLDPGDISPAPQRLDSLAATSIADRSQGAPSPSPVRALTLIWSPGDFCGSGRAAVPVQDFWPGPRAARHWRQPAGTHPAAGCEIGRASGGPGRRRERKRERERERAPPKQSARPEARRERSAARPRRGSGREGGGPSRGGLDDRSDGAHIPAGPKPDAGAAARTRLGLGCKPPCCPRGAASRECAALAAARCSREPRPWPGIPSLPPLPLRLGVVGPLSL